MKIIGQLLVWGSLTCGVWAAATAYLVSLELPDQQLLGLSLAAPAGKVTLADGTVEPIAGKELQEAPKVTAPMLAELRDAGVSNLRVKEFEFGRWRGKWYFLLSLVGLVAGGLLSRLAVRPRAATQTDRGQTDQDWADTPEQVLESLQTLIDRLPEDLSELSDAAARLETIVEQLDRAEQTHMAAFVEARPELVARLGLAGYAGLMDSYAAAERQIHRAWSAAADGAYEEAITCLDEAAALVRQTRQRLATAGEPG